MVTLPTDNALTVQCALSYVAILVFKYGVFCIFEVQNDFILMAEANPFTSVCDTYLNLITFGVC